MRGSEILLTVKTKKSMQRRVIILGAGGALGKAVSRIFTRSSWACTPVHAHADETTSADAIIVPRNASATDQYKIIKSSLEGKHGRNGAEIKFDAIINVAGGLAMDSAKVCTLILRLCPLGFLV